MYLDALADWYLSSKASSNAYDEDGNLIEETDAKGNKTTYTYDDEGRLTK